MTSQPRIIASLTALALAGGVPVGAARAAQTTIQAKASVVKSLTLTKKQDLDFGTVTLSGATGAYTVSISQAGVLSCPAGATCAGAPVPGIMNVQGSNQQLVRITVAPTNLVNSVDGSTIPLTPDAPVEARVELRVAHPLVPLASGPARPS